MATWMPTDEGKVQPDFLGTRPVPGTPAGRAERPEPALWDGRDGRDWLPGFRPERAGRAAAGVPPAAGAPGRCCKTSGMRITVLAGGVGAARFLRGLRAAAPGADITVIGNTGDDFTPFGLHVSPDLDTVMYTLGGGVSEEQGWGRAGESRVVLSELAAYGAGPGWFGLGDKDLATHILRTQVLAGGGTLSEATQALCERWQPGVTLLPMSDDAVRTHVTVELDGREQVLHFQEWWVRYRAAIPARLIEAAGAGQARPAPGVLEAISAADFVLFPPSNPVVSIGAILAVPGIAAALAGKVVVGVSPIIGGAPVHGMADACLTAIGVQTSAAAVAAHYGRELLDGWLVDERDKDAVEAPELAGITVRARPLYMTDVAATAEIARAAIDLAEQVRA
jgi:LPPG:FO 2-phospho-L-lactate transferase